MTDHAQEVRNLLTDARQLCDALGLSEGSKPNSGGLLIRCPAHEDRDASCGITKGPDGTLRARCFSCQWSADALGMIAHVRGLNLSSGDDFRAILAEGAQIGGDLLLADEITHGRPLPTRKPVPRPEPEPEREYPDQSEVTMLWSSAKSVTADAESFDLLRSRAIDPDVASRMGLVRVFDAGAPLPPWATFRGASWGESGHRMILPVVDHLGKLRSVRSWQVDGRDGPKRLPPARCKASGLVLANRAAVAMFRGAAKPERLVITEGEPDFLTWVTRVPDGVAVVGVGSGSWTREHAERVHKSTQVFVRTHCDPAGEKYATMIAESLGDRCPIWRLRDAKPGDENDKARDGRLPTDPADACEPVNDPARKIAADTPRVRTVVEILSASYKRASDPNPPVVWTTGHWKVDDMTGGIRPNQTWVLGGDTSWGKSSFAVAVADENMAKGATVLIVSTEDDESIYGDRLMARRAQISAKRLRDKQLQVQEYSQMTAVLNAAKPLPVYLDGRCVTFERLAHQIAQCIEQHNVDIVILDYVQECRTKKKHEDDRRMFREIARLFRTTVKMHGKAGILLSQLTIQDPSKPPTKNDVRECKDMVHGSEVVALGWSPQKEILGADGTVLYHANSKVMIVDKAKTGDRGSVELKWNELSKSFDNVPDPDAPPPEFIEDIDDMDASISGRCQ